MLARQPRHLASAAHAFERGVQPQREQDMRVDRRAPGVAATRLDRIGQPAEVLPLGVAPHQTGAVLLAQQIADGTGAAARLIHALAEVQQRVHAAVEAHLVVQSSEGHIIALTEAAFGVDQKFRHDEKGNAFHARWRA